MLVLPEKCFLSPRVKSQPTGTAESTAECPVPSQEGATLPPDAEGRVDCWNPGWPTWPHPTAATFQARQCAVGKKTQRAK